MPERLPPKPATSAGQFDLFGKRADGPRVYSVSELTRELKAILEGRFPSVLVKGEVSNLRSPSSGHLYFTLKDADACLDAVLFRTEARRLRFSVQNGLSLVARGRLAVYEPQGRYQLVCDTVEPLGAGALQIAFEQLKERLQKEGLFAAARKRKLPFLPRRVAVVTSPSGAAVHDFLRVLHRRHPNLGVLIVPARVQGEGAAQEIARGIVRAAKQPRVDVVVVARGGGSLEDLWAFNEEVVARALCACPVPTVSAVGHEIDVTIADYCADVRAPTPTAAAEIIARVKDELVADLAQRKARLGRAMRAQLERKRGHLDKLRARVADPRRLIGDRKLRLDRARQRLEDFLHDQLAARQQMLRALRERLQAQHPRERLHRLEREVARLEEKLKALARRALAARRHRYEGLTARLDALSPLKVLARGYAVAFDERGHALLQAAQVRAGERVRVRLHEGELSAQVIENKNE
ncbi:MAG TPA: exodeoxyribonuclease VII large subunit [Myxococcales bacterium]|jgi:exodeoxyribonuclease VII large subunit|nr:exodeoxyribonuclease VII large subunit [Myxococcales bacterium]